MEKFLAIKKYCIPSKCLKFVSIQSLIFTIYVKFFAMKNKTFESWVELLNFLRHPGTIMDSLKEY